MNQASGLRCTRVHARIGSGIASVRPALLLWKRGPWISAFPRISKLCILSLLAHSIFLICVLYFSLDVYIWVSPSVLGGLWNKYFNISGSLYTVMLGLRYNISFSRKQHAPGWQNLQRRETTKLDSLKLEVTGMEICLCCPCLLSKILARQGQLPTQAHIHTKMLLTPLESSSWEHSGSRLFSLQTNEAVYSPSWRWLESDK